MGVNYSASWAAFLFVSVALMYFTASQQAYSANAIVAAITCLSLIGASVMRNRPLWDAEMAASPTERFETLRTASANARFMGFAYAWGSFSMVTMYYLTDLHWYHAYQYALYMAAVAMLAIVAYLILSGKMQIIGKDWAADHVFLWGSLAILGLSLLALAVQWRLGKPSASSSSRHSAS